MEEKLEKVQLEEYLVQNQLMIVFSIYFLEEIFAVKVINRNVKFDSSFLKRKIHLISTLSHPNIVKYIDFYEDENNYYIIYEMINGGELFYYTQSNNVLI